MINDNNDNINRKLFLKVPYLVKEKHLNLIAYHFVSVQDTSITRKFTLLVTIYWGKAKEFSVKSFLVCNLSTILKYKQKKNTDWDILLVAEIMAYLFPDICHCS